MSYEGFEKWLCANGHLRVFDCYMTPEEGTARCDCCGAEFVWRHSVDETNGYEPENDVELAVAQPAETHTCSCGNVHVVAEARYQIPAKEAQDAK